MYGLVFYGDQLFGVPSASSIHGPSQHYTIVFNAFVLMQLFNQVSCLKLLLPIPQRYNCTVLTASLRVSTAPNLLAYKIRLLPCLVFSSLIPLSLTTMLCCIKIT